MPDLENVKLYRRREYYSRVAGLDNPWLYGAWCSRCLVNVQSGGNIYWKTKSRAVFHARAHLAYHPHRENTLGRYGDVEIVDTITL